MKTILNNQKKLISTFIMSALMVCSLAFPAFASDPTLIFSNAYLCTISGQTATPGVSMVNNSNVPSGSQHIEIEYNHNISADMNIYSTGPVLSTNQSCIHLKDETTQNDVSISVYRLGDGTPTSLEKRHLFFDANLVSGHAYKITIDPQFTCYNSYTLGHSDYIYFTAN